MAGVLCPTLLFIEDNEWEDKEKRNRFLDNLQETFEYIIRHKISIYWNDAIECSLWEQPNLHPWLTQDTTSATLLLYDCIKKVVEVPDNLAGCDCIPEIESSINVRDVLTPTLSLIHWLLIQKERFSFIVDKQNNHAIVFHCDCHQSELAPEILCPFSEFLSLPNEIILRWNKIKSTPNAFTELLEITRKRYIATKKFVYIPRYTSSFLRSIYKTTDSKERLLYDIAQRLTVYPDEAARLNGFHDESIEGGRNTHLRSFRVNDVCRVYYEYQKDGVILFTKYTGSDGHDKGTRHT